MKHILYILFVFTFVMFFSCSNRSEEQVTPKTIQQIHNEKGIPVTTSKIGNGIIRRIERSNGTLCGAVEATLANGMGGTVKSINVSLGDRVKKDAVIAVMEVDGGSPIDVAQSAYDYAQKAYGRARKLQEKGAISKEQVEGARVQYEDAKRKLGQATVGVNVKAPFTGTVIEIYQNVGSKIGEKTPLVKIADLSKIKIETQVNQQAIDFYKVGQKAFLLVNNDTLWGYINRIALGANQLAHSFKVTTLFPNPNRRLKPGAFKQVYTIVKEKSQSLYVPIEVVNFDQDNTPYLYTFDNGKAVKTNVSIGITTGNFYEITQGCTSDDQIIMSGLTMLNDGVKVNVVNK
jgi:RND family efflux transporter MFP subunit